MDKYKSQVGFVKMPILRGFDKIGNVFSALCKAKEDTGYNSFICGGYVRYCISPKENPAPANDVDIYCESVDVFEWLKEYFKSCTEIRYENPISTTFKVCDIFPVTIQLIYPVNQGAIVATGDMETVIGNFDFTIVRCAIVDSETALADADFDHDERGNLLRIKNIHCPISSTLRCMKYARKGYFLKVTEAAKLFIDWDRRTPDYKFDILNYLTKVIDGEQLTEEQIDQLEALLRID